MDLLTIADIAGDAGATSDSQRAFGRVAEADIEGRITGTGKGNMSDDQKPLLPGVKAIPVSKLGGLGIGLPDFQEQQPKKKPAEPAAKATQRMTLHKRRAGLAPQG